MSGTSLGGLFDSFAGTGHGEQPVICSTRQFKIHFKRQVDDTLSACGFP